jgi:hypothetical protein
MNALIQVARDASPYLAVELLLPGGSVIALLLWLFRHRSKKGVGPLGMPEIGHRSWIRRLASRFGLDPGVHEGLLSPRRALLARALGLIRLYWEAA